MRVWRLSRAPRELAALIGEGGLHGAGRWHQRGVRIVYTAATLSLAALEVLVRVDRWSEAPDLVAIEIDVPASVELEHVAAAELSGGWRAPTPTDETQAIGGRWIASARSAVLSVPSAVIPIERNFLINPAHPDFKRIQVASRHSFSFDRRLLRTSRSPR